MPSSSEPNAVVSARQALQLDTSITAEVWRIHRLDRLNADYDLVIFGEHDSAVGIAAVTINDTAITESARLPGRQPQLTINAQEAIQLAQLSGSAKAELVWQPSDISRSPLYPFWKVYDATQTRYVDQQGRLWEHLTSSKRGG